MPPGSLPSRPGLPNLGGYSSPREETVLSAGSVTKMLNMCTQVLLFNSTVFISGGRLKFYPASRAPEVSLGCHQKDTKTTQRESKGRQEGFSIEEKEAATSSPVQGSRPSRRQGTSCLPCAWQCWKHSVLVLTCLPLTRTLQGEV